MTAEHARLNEARGQDVPWRKWGPYLSERQWGTVREDYSTNGDAWNYFTHDQARSRAYRWGEDGIAGLSDDRQLLCFALALWNGRDPILKERLFGLTNSEGNHGEDVKEYYFYLDSTPTHSYMKCLYKYPQSPYPYNDLVATNRRRDRNAFEYELIDTGIFDEDRYFDVVVEYAKNTPEDILIRITAYNRGPEPAALHLLPTLWLRNTWSAENGAAKPVLRRLETAADSGVIAATHAKLGNRLLYCEGAARIVFTENESNNRRLFGTPNPSPYVKDAFNEWLVHGREETLNPKETGTKAAAHYERRVEGGGSASIRLRLTDQRNARPFGKAFDDLFATRLREADEFYAAVTPVGTGEDRARVMRQALAGMLWSKQFYSFEADRWLGERGAGMMQSPAFPVRNREWFHMVNDNVISMPDKWEYPWYAAWDLAFHAIALSGVDVDFAKQQIELTLSELYQHPSGQIPAYEWNFSDVNPPVHAWASIFLYRLEQARTGTGDVEFLKRIFGKLMLNFTWWVNRKDRFGRNVFEGGFLGLDNIGVFDRSAPLPTGGSLEQADGTAWMALFCQNMLEIAVEIAGEDPAYEDLVVKFVEHFLWIAAAMNHVGRDGMWDEEDGFYYDQLRWPGGEATRLKVRSVVGLLPICATTVIEPWQRERVPHATARLEERLRRMPELMNSIHPTGPRHLGYAQRGIIGLVGPDRLRRILHRMLDENEFLGPHGIRAVSRYHADHPYVFVAGGEEHRVDYLPAESNTGMFGGNSNWRGPVWFPINVALLRGLLSYYLYYGDGFRIECPTGSGRMMNLFEVSREIAGRLIGTFERDAQGKRPVFGGTEKFQSDPHWRDHLLFYEYFHGDNGAGLGASHQTGWTGLVAALIQLFGSVDAKSILERGKREAFERERVAATGTTTPAEAGAMEDAKSR
jgi:hypothetical protein